VLLVACFCTGRVPGAISTVVVIHAHNGTGRPWAPDTHTHTHISRGLLACTGGFALYICK